MSGNGHPQSRKRGGIRRHGNGFQVRVSAGADPVTGERIVLHETVRIALASSKSGGERAERDAYKDAERALTRLPAHHRAGRVTGQ